LSVAHIVERSGVSRRTFYDVFSDREECFLAAFEQALGFATDRLASAYESEKAWRERVRDGLLCLLWFFDEQPRLARVLLVESAAGGCGVSERRSQVIAQLTRIIEQGAGESGLVAGELVSEGIVGGVLSILSTRLADPEHEPLVTLANELMSMIAAPFLGAAAAKRELNRTVPATPQTEHDAQASLSDPFKDAGMRLTYRTVRVLMAIAEYPGASNRQIGNTAEITDQGQISKLLGRMQRLGMIVNTGAGARHGAPNEWALTTTGTNLTNTIRTHTENHTSVSTHSRGESF
jgi:AcrR family transcriptional regulator